MRPPYIPAKKVEEMDIEEFLDYLDMTRNYGPKSKDQINNDRYEPENAPRNFNCSSMLEDNQGFVSSGLFQKWKNGTISDKELEEMVGLNRFYPALSKSIFTEINF